eukprot:6003257-Pleurochrysis_carterae.AAC.1
MFETPRGKADLLFAARGDKERAVNWRACVQLQAPGLTGDSRVCSAGKVRQGKVDGSVDETNEKYGKAIQSADQSGRMRVSTRDGSETLG